MSILTYLTTVEFGAGGLATLPQALADLGIGRPLLVSDRLIVTGTSQDALSVSPYTGEILGHITLSEAAAPFSPVVAGGTVLLVSNDARLIALR